jgi:hypothetical protein
MEYLMIHTYKDNLTIKRVIESNQPFFIGRIAGIELQTAYNLVEKNTMELSYNKIELENNAGIRVENHDSLTHYTTNLIQSYEHCTHIAEWDQKGDVFAITGKGQNMIAERTSHIPKLNALSLEPYYFEESWMTALKGKRILIIHPFVITIQKQVENLSALFPNRSWFEDCTFQLVKPPLTLAGNHQNKFWEEHYKECIQSIKQCDTFDIALVAAGGYGMLLCDFIFKELGRSVLYIGGALQLFFGIIGKRWFTNKDILKLVNDEWIRPNKKDVPDNFKKVENGCYW